MRNNTKRESLFEQIYESLKDSIITGEYHPGEKLKESSIAEKYNASRTPVREAVRKLESEGLVVFTPGQGVEVTELSKEKIMNLYECRSVLEGLAARKAATLIGKEQLDLLEENLILCKQFLKLNENDKVVSKNTQFHDTIINASHNEPLIAMMEMFRAQLMRYRIFHSNVGFRPDFLDEHQAIYEALKTRNSELAEELTKQHFLNDADYFVKWSKK